MILALVEKVVYFSLHLNNIKYMALFHILAVNPGSTSTKVAVYVNTKVVFLKSISHSAEELSKFKKVSDQFQYRKEIILDELSSANIETEIIQAVVGRGGLIRPIKSGIYRINEAMRKDLSTGILGNMPVTWED